MGRAALTRENPEVLIGQTVKGRYRIVEKTGENEAGFAYLAEDKIVEGKRVSVRILMDEEASAFFTDNVFAEERVSLSHVNHPNVASVIDSGELPEGKPFIITEYVEGKTVKEMFASSGQFNVLRAARIVRQASYALSEMHQSGIVHRGLTPENIVLTVSENGSEQVKITDFGVSRGNSARENLEYKAPERSDFCDRFIFACGHRFPNADEPSAVRRFDGKRSAQSAARRFNVAPDRFALRRFAVGR